MINDTRTHFTYDPTTHTTYCERKVKNGKFYGVAKCHPDDWDIESKIIGEHFAYMRSMIAELVANRDELKIQLKTLNYLYNILEQNPRVYYNSIECYTIRRQIKIIEQELKDIRKLIKNTRQDIRDIIAEQDKRDDIIVTGSES